MSYNPKGAALYDLAVRLDRAAAVAYQIGAVPNLLERYWDWYVLLLGKYEAFLAEYQQRQATALLQNLSSGGVVLGRALTADEARTLWLSHLERMRQDIRRYLTTRVPALADKWAGKDSSKTSADSFLASH